MYSLTVLAAIMLLTTADTGDERRAPRAGPAHEVFQFASDERSLPDAAERAHVLEQASQFLGASPDEYEVSALVSTTFEDESPFGGPRGVVPAYRVDVEVGVPAKPTGKGIVPVSLVLDRTGRLLCAYMLGAEKVWSLPQEEWVPAERRAGDLGWINCRLADVGEFESKLPALLAAAFELKKQISPVTPLVVFRPRVIERQVFGADPTKGPIRTEATREWIIESRGIVALWRYGLPFTGQLLALRDGSLVEQGLSTYLP